MPSEKITKPGLWMPGNNVLLRGVYNNRLVYVQSLRVVKDTPEETALCIFSGAECVAPSTYIHQGHDWNLIRWQEATYATLRLEKYLWRTNRLLILLEPEKFYSTIFFWDEASGQFTCYYVNFQLPFRRTPLGFDTLDLDLDIIIDPSFNWEWKDEEEYREGVRTGGIKQEWAQEVERAKSEVFERLEKRIYPLDSSWLDWRPDLAFESPYLPENWDEAYS